MQLTLLLCVFASLGGSYADRYFPVMNATYRLLNRLLDDYEQKTAEIITTDIKKVEESTQQIETATRQVSEKMDNVIQSVMNATRVEYAKAEQEAKSKNVDVSKCLEAALIVSMNSNQTKENALTCTKSKAEEAMKNVEGMKTSLTKLLEEFKTYRAAGEECVIGVDGLVAATRAFWCLEKVKAQALSTRFIKLPSVKRDIRKQARQLSSLPKTIAGCSKEKEASKFAVASQLIGQRINTCINDYIKKSTGTSEGSETQGETSTTKVPEQNQKQPSPNPSITEPEPTKLETESDSTKIKDPKTPKVEDSVQKPETTSESQTPKPVIEKPKSDESNNVTELSEPPKESNKTKISKTENSVPEESPASESSETHNEAALNTSASEETNDKPEPGSNSSQPKPEAESNPDQPESESTSPSVQQTN